MNQGDINESVKMEDIGALLKSMIISNPEKRITC